MIFQFSLDGLNFIDPKSDFIFSLAYSILSFELKEARSGKTSENWLNNFKIFFFKFTFHLQKEKTK